jgi:hypothetical protein
MKYKENCGLTSGQLEDGYIALEGRIPNTGENVNGTKSEYPGEYPSDDGFLPRPRIYSWSRPNRTDMEDRG